MDELENKRNEMLASATLWAKEYIKDQKSEFWQDMLQDSVLENWKVNSLILGHLMTGSYAAAHELLRQHLFSDELVEREIESSRSMAQESLDDNRRMRDA